MVSLQSSLSFTVEHCGKSFERRMTSVLVARISIDEAVIKFIGCKVLYTYLYYILRILSLVIP